MALRFLKASQLPDNLKKLALRNALDVRHNSFHIDMDKLIQSLKRQLHLKMRALAAARPMARINRIF